MNMLFKTAIALAFMCLPQSAQAESLRLAVTTSFHNSGLSDVLLPHIKTDIGLDVQLIVVGTGQALRLGRSGDVDAILVHSKQAEKAFVANGFATHRREIMYNDFVFVGPQKDLAKLPEKANAADALAAIKAVEAIFVSRGDDSGTHRKEIALWQSANLEPASFKPEWYRAVGSGMGATLNAASGMNAYTLSDRASWLKFQNKGSLKLLFSGDPALFNQYAYLPIASAAHSHVKANLASMLEDWLVSKKAQDLIGSYTLDGEVLFTPNAQ